MKYAPVAILTLNRLDHFRECIESLNMCNWADKTDVYVALDYPPSEKYVEGYRAICEYLDSAHFGFKNLHIIRRDRNYGLGPKGNLYALLSEQIWPNYDRVIISEDDNVFAKTFLQFMDCGLGCCERRKDILAVGGFAIPAKWKDDGSEIVLLNSNANAWGFGMLRERYLEMQSVNVLDFYHSVLSSKERKQRILAGSKNDCGALAWYVMMGNGAVNDTFNSIYIRDKGMYCLFPKTSKTLNRGTDGSGQTSGKTDIYGMNTVELDDRTYFDPSVFDEIPPYYDETMDSVNAVYHIPWWKMLWVRFVYVTHSFWRKHPEIGNKLRKTYVKWNPRL